VFERRRAVRILLRSLVITFEGQAELVATEVGGYFAARLCSISRELVSKSTVELSNEGGEDGDQPSTWHVMFNLPIPGWLPASDLYGDCRQGASGTQYNLYATMKYANAAEDAHHGPIWLSALCSPFSSRNKVAHARPCPVTLNRFALPPSAASYRPSFYTVRASGKEVRTENQRPPIPEDIISKIEMLVSVPECVSVDGDRFPFSLSVRTPSLSDDQASKLRVSHLSLHLLQIDQYRYVFLPPVIRSRSAFNAKLVLLVQLRANMRRAIQFPVRRNNHHTRPCVVHTPWLVCMMSVC
jgi:hypothetical protein